MSAGLVPSGLVVHARREVVGMSAGLVPSGLIVHARREVSG